MADTSKSARQTWRERRVAHLAALVAAGEYSVPPIDVAHAILFGRPKWGDDPLVALREANPYVDLPEEVPAERASR
jgi:hypothetical protein